MRFGIALLLVLPLWGQDELRVQSPHGNVEFRVFLAPQEDRNLFRLAYQVDYQGKRAIETSYLGLDIWEQEPLLGENTGLIAAKRESKPQYRALIAQYMQNGSLGRRIDLEVRVFDTGVAFRYALPKSVPMRQLLIADEATEFVTAGGAAAPHISEVPAPPYPKMHLEKEGDREEGSVLVTRLARVPGKPMLAYEGATPITTAWRVITFGNTKEVPQNIIESR